MAGETISQLPAGAALTGAEVAPFVQNGLTVQISASQIAAFTGGGGGGSGTVTNVSGINANGFAWSIANPNTTPQLTISTTVNGFLQGNGTSVSNAGTVGSGTSLVVGNSVTGTGSQAVFATGPTVSNLVVTGAFTATGLVTNADLVNSSLTVAGQSVSLGGSTAISAANLSNGVTGTGSVVLSGSPTLVTPVANTLTLGVVSTTTGSLQLANSSSANLTTIQAGNAAAARTYTWPTNFGAAGSVLQDAAGNGVLSWGAGSAGAGTVTTVSVVTANGFAGTVANATTTPAITLTTSVTGILSGNGTAISAATTTGSGSVVLATSPTLVTPALGVATATSLAIGGATIGANALAVTGTVLLNNAINYGGVTLSNSVTGTGSMVLSAAPTITGHPTIEGVTSTGATGTGAFVFATSPTLVTPVIGVATGTSLQLGTASSSTGSLILANSGSAFLTTIQAGNNAAARTYTWPTNFGAAGTILTDAAGNGVLSWTAGGGAGSGTVTNVSVVTANGFAGTVATASTTPAITLSTTITGVLQGNGTTISAATTTGTGSVVLATGPTINPINKITLTPPATGATITIADGTTLATTGNVTISGTNTGDQTIVLTGDVTGAGTGTFTTTIANNAVSNAKLRQSAGLSVIGNASNLTGNVADITGTAGQALTVNAAGTSLAFGAVQPAGGGTGATNLVNHSVLVGAGTNTVTQVGPAASGTLFTGRGASADPAFSSTPVLGANGLTAGTLSFANSAVGGAFVTIQNPGATAAYNFNLPATSGTSGQTLLSGGGGSAPMTWGSVPLSGPVSTIKGTPAYFTTTNGSTLGNLTQQTPVNVLAYGADPTGLSDSRSAINSAWASSPIIYLPAGKYLISGPLTPNSGNNPTLIGDGSFNCNTVGSTGNNWTTGAGTLIVSNDLTSNLIDFPNASGISNITLMGFSLTRTAQASSATAYGIRISRGDEHRISDVMVFNHGIGIGLLFQGGYAIAENILSFGNKSHGVQLQGQWQLYNVLSSSNGGDGFRLDNPGALGSNSSGQWSRLSTFNNAGWGFNCTTGSTGQALEGFRINDSFFGNDQLGEMNLDSYAGNAHKITGTQFECGFTPSGGGNLIVPTAVNITANNPSIMFDNCYITTGTAAVAGGGSSGIVSALTATARTSNGALATLNVSNTNIVGVNFGVANTGSGIHCSGAGARILISNCTIDSFRNPINLDTGANQQLNVSNCSIFSQSDVYAGAGVAGIFMQSSGGKATITNTEIAGLLGSANFTIGIDIINNNGAGTVVGCGINTNTTPASITGTSVVSYTAGNY